MRKLVGSGTFVSVRKSQSQEGKLKKTFKFPLLESTARDLKRVHDQYVTELDKAIPIPETVMDAERLEDGRYQVTITQDDLTPDGSSLADFLRSGGDLGKRLGAYKSALEGTLKVCRLSGELESQGIKLGLESNPNNWWVNSRSETLFFDTTPPLMSVDGRIDTDILVPKENPTFLGRLIAKLARLPVIRKLSEAGIRQYAFNWPTTIRTFLIKTIDCVPSMRDQLVETTRKAVEGLEIDDRYRKQFQKKLTNLSIKVELMKLRVYDWLASIGQAKATE
jgi:hypothetical protein